MNFEPQKLFIGLMDFFSIFLPGALLTYLLRTKMCPILAADLCAKPADAEGWAVFLFASYLLGHLVFLLGSWLDEFYDWARRHTLDAQIRRFAHGGKLLHWLARALIWLVFKGERNLAVNQAVKIKQQALGALQAQDSVNAFQWSKALLNIESPSSLALVQRFEADSKFFRCLAVVLLLLLAAWPLRDLWPLPLQDGWPRAGVPVVLVLLLLLALWRYMEQRFKSINQAYWSVITLTASGGKVVLSKATPLQGSPTHAGGVVSRTDGGKVEYLLVEAKKDPSEWVLPKGHVEESEDFCETAVREVHEETGVWARIKDHVDNPSSYPVNGTAITVRFYLMEFAAWGRQKDANRRHKWLSPQEAIVKATHPETKKLLELAEDRRLRG
jgi:ADP-ribose pyrophosphatase YjhB (NUDIX family)